MRVHEARWRSVPFWSLYKRGKKTGFPSEELLSVYRDYGVIKKTDRDDNGNRPGEDMSVYQLVDCGDLVLNKMKTWQGSLGVSGFRGIVSPAYFVYKPQTDDDPRFLHYALRSAHHVGYYASISKGVRPNQWDLQPELLDSMRVFLPGISTQRKIAGHLGKIDDMIGKLDDLEGSLRIRRAATWSATHSKGFEQVKLQWLMQEVDERAGAQNLELPLLSVSIHNGVTRRHELWSGQQAGADLSKYKVARSGDIVLNRMRAFQGGLGHTSIDGLVSPDYAVLRPGRRLTPSWTEYVMRSPEFIEAMAQQVRGIGTVEQGNVRTPRINIRDLLVLSVPVPPTTQLAESSIELERTTTRIDVMLGKVSALRDLLIERRATLIPAFIVSRKEVA